MDLHPPTHGELKIPRVNVHDMLGLSVMQIFTYLHKGSTNNMFGIGCPLNHGGDKCDVSIRGLVPL